MSLNELFQQAIAHQQAGRLQQAESVARQILQSHPDHPAALHFLGVLALQVGRDDVACDLIGRAVAIKPDYTEARFNLAIAQAGMGQLERAVASYALVIAAIPDHADAHYNLGAALHQLGRLDEAMARYRHALQLRPTFAQAHNNLGIALQERGLPADAVGHFRAAIDHAPAYAEAFFNLANALKEQGQLDQAIANYRHALEIRPDFAEALDNLGVALHEMDLLDEAIACHRRALQLRPEWAETLGNLATALQEQGRTDEAIDAAMQALAIQETPEIRTAFVQCVKQMTSVPDGARATAIRALLVRAMSEPWARPSDLVEVVFSFIRLDSVIDQCVARATAAWPSRLPFAELFDAETFKQICDDELLRAMLENAPVYGVELEQFLTLTRYALLEKAEAQELGEQPARAATLAFQSALARQCFNNEYVFSYTADELAKAEKLRDELETRLATASPASSISSMQIANVASYFPLRDLTNASALLQHAWPPDIDALLEQQIRAPLSEREIRAQVRELTSVEDDVSRKVREQYEENPYPRWVKCAPIGKAMPLNAFLRKQSPHMPFVPLDKAGELDVLVAGCGTGQHSIETAQQYQRARVLAVDLSLSSICYAQRKTREMGIANLEYAHADVMKLGSIDREFDVIESVGVLHHMHDPMAGWRVLTGLLRDNGFMRLGFYSEHARRAVVAARQQIAIERIGSSALDIRQFRQHVMSPQASPALKPLERFRDFFGTSECRDLLFHVQEHRYTLPQLKECLAALRLQFLGFSLEPAVMKQYALRFPHDVSRTNLDHWNTFEIEHPETFAGMYQFWVQKAPGQ